ncbi:MAG: Gfo/Idh/MocA family oxidoreductase [Planctomycetota bacterium]|nr:Gfo/Idh/MocA family oxidoreductase [Planctomycetota bacterium]
MAERNNKAAGKTRIGVIGCGAISGIYLKNCKSYPFLEVAACADLDMSKAEARAKEFEVPKVCTVKELLADPAIEIVLNLTVPKAHGEVAVAALQAGKHVYNEKPLALSRGEMRRMFDLARRRKLRIGCAPDTFMGGGIQTCRKLIDDGWIGEPVGAAAFMTSRGPEGWHPSPEFYYKPGGGPMLDMGPYYLTALVNLIGPIESVAGFARASFPTRVIGSQPLKGTIIKVETPTHVAGTIRFASGAIGTILMSFDVWAAQLPRIEIYGSLGTLSVPDPNTFGGPVRIKRKGMQDWAEVPLTHGYSENSRGLGVADMAAAIRSGRGHRASGELAGHVLDAMLAFLDASESGRAVRLSTKCARPAPLPMGLSPFEIDR